MNTNHTLMLEPAPANELNPSLPEADSRPLITCECALWGRPCPNWLWPEDEEHDATHAAALAAVA